MFNAISINFRPDDTTCLSLLDDLVDFLKHEKKHVLLPRYDIIRKENYFCYAVDEDALIRDADLVVVIGGDGTFLRTARLYCGCDKPIFGINRGRLGFLTEFNPDEYKKYLKDVFVGKFTKVERLVLEAIHMRGNKEMNRSCFINDAVISKGSVLRPIRVELEIDGNFLNSYSGDGLIISTPTGSTAYSLSAGGPILTPFSAKVMLLSPICPHSLAMRPMIVPSTSVFKARIATEFKNLLLTIDGQEAIHIDGEDEVIVRESEHSVHLITHPEKNYYTILREKLGWG